MREHRLLCLCFLLVIHTQISSGFFSYLKDAAFKLWSGGEETTCSSRQFRCQDGQCVFSSWRCDGRPDCTAGEDEANCTHQDCPSQWFECDDGMCIESDLKCDGYHDCFDWSDETYCSEDHQLATCGPGHFTCVGLRDCILMTSRCDGDYDCPDRSDEVGCEPVTSCEEDEFLCTNGSHCVPKLWRCDGHTDCPDRSDETSCDIVHTCSAERGYYLCRDKENCVDLDKVCDGNLDCPDRSDELNNCSAVCRSLQCQGSCVPTTQSAQCGCPPGFRQDPASRQCKDVDECTEPSTPACSQICMNMPGYYHCACQPGYSLTPDRTSCRALGPEPVLFYTSATEIYGKGLNSGNLGRLQHGRFHISNMAFYDRESQVFWTETATHRVMSAYFDDRRLQHPVEFLSVGLEEPVAVSVDWVTSSLYVGDAGKGNVAACSLHRAVCTLVLQHITHLTDLLVEPESRSLYYLRGGEAAGLWRSDMAGQGATRLLKDNVRQPRGLALDTVARRLYWVDTDKQNVESALYDGSDRKVVLSWEVHHPVAVAVFEDSVFWADKGKRRVMSAHKVTGHDRKTVVNDVGLLTSLTLAHPVLQPQDIPNPCLRSSCSDLCLLSNNPYGYVCACPVGQQLLPDQRSCQAAEESRKLLMAAGEAIQQFSLTSLGNALSRVTDAGDATLVLAVDYDLQEDAVYFTDRDASNNCVIKRRPLKSTKGSSVTSKVVVSDLGVVTSLVVDWVGRNLLWVDAYRDKIEFSRLDGQWRRTLVQVDNPRSLTVHLTRGQLYFCVWGEHPGLHQCDMGGDDCWHLVTSRVWRPTSLALDYASDTLYWADLQLGEIMAVTLDDTHTVTSVSASREPLSLVVDQGLLFWSDYNSHSVFTLDLSQGHDGAKPRRFHTGSDKVTALAIIRPRLLRAVHNSCSQSECSHLCLALPDQHHMCVCPVDMVSHDLKTCLHEAWACEGEEWRCMTSPQCLEAEQRCDGREDCMDASDELNCTTTCQSQHFRCQNGRCVHLNWTCDGENDCDDNSDETLPRCGAVMCRPHEFRCDRSLCLPKADVCNGLIDCDDESDEDNCHVTCAAEDFRCGDGQCLDSFLRCDGDKDCPGGEDEFNCTDQACSKAEFGCGTGQCVALSLLCNGLQECPDGSDEASPTCPGVSPSPRQVSTCGAGQFRCQDGECVPSRAACDGELDCYDASDETTMDCPDGRSGWLRCGEGHFRCDTGQCLPPQALCNGSKECPWGEDEDPSSCPDPGVQCPQGQFACVTGQCLPLPLRCNGRLECLDGSDEGSDCPTSCAKGHNPCNQLCSATPSGPVCSCLPGFRLADPHTCEDEDECEQGSPCSQFCHNTKGGYRCHCQHGYRLHSDGRLCKATGERPHLLLSYPGGLLSLSLDGHVDRVLSHHAPIYVFDVILSTGEIFFVTRESAKSPSQLFKWTTSAPEPLLTSDMVISDLAVDWLARNLYVAMTTVDRGSLLLCGVDSWQCHTLVTGRHVMPRQLLVSPKRGTLLWLHSPFSPHEARTIMAASMDGSDVRQLVGGLPHSVVAMAMDYVTDALYWINADARAVERVGLSGDGRRPVMRLGSFPHAASLDFFEGSLFLSNWRNSVTQLTLTENRTRVLLYLDRVMDLAVVHGLKQPPGANACGSMQCSHLCALTPGGATCLCPDGYVTDPSHSSRCLAPTTPTPSTPQTTPAARPPPRTRLSTSSSSPPSARTSLSVPSSTSPSSAKTPSRHTTAPTGIVPLLTSAPFSSLSSSTKSSTMESTSTVSLISAPKTSSNANAVCQPACRNNGTCVVASGKPYCKCSPGHVGSDCTKPAVGYQATEDEKTGVIVGLVIGVILVVAAAIGIVAFVCIRRRTRNSLKLPNFVRFHPSAFLSKPEDREELIPEIQFGVANFRRFPDEVDEAPPDWWRSNIRDSRVSLDHLTCTSPMPKAPPNTPNNPSPETRPYL